MRIVAHNKFSFPINTEITSVVVYDDSDNPIAATIKLADGVINTTHIKDDDFYKVLQMLGVDRTVAIETMNPNKLKSF